MVCAGRPESRTASGFSARHEAALVACPEAPAAHQEAPSDLLQILAITFSMLGSIYSLLYLINSEARQHNRSASLT